MKTKKPEAQVHYGSPRSSARFVLWILGLTSLLIVAAIFLRGRGSKTAHDRDGATPAEVAIAPSTTLPATRPHSDGVANNAAPRMQPVYQQPKPSPGMLRLVDSLVNFQSPGEVLTEDQATAWRTNLRSLIEQGAGAVPAISEFLAKNVDLAFSPSDRLMVGYSSVRSAMLDALAQIGGPVAVNAMAQVLQTAADPREIALLAQNLEKLDPGVHQTEVLDAAREALGMAAQGNLPGRDVAPLFEVLQQFGGASAVADLERSANQWNYYSMIALANLPDQAGVGSLVQIAQGQGGAGFAEQAIALQMLAQLAPQSGEARAALLDQVRQNRLSAFDWSALAPVLAGKQMGYQNAVFGNNLAGVSPNDLMSVTLPSNERYFTAPLGALTLDQITQRQALIDELVSAASSPAATQALQRARTLLANRLFQIAANSGK